MIPHFLLASTFLINFLSIDNKDVCETKTSKLGCLHKGIDSTRPGFRNKDIRARLHNLLRDRDS